MAACWYDLHLHSCLSPCGDGLMTPPNIANMAYINGLQLFALCDHNSTRNVRAVAQAAAELPLVFIPGMEVTTAEEVHVVCLFPTVEAAEAAGQEVESLLPSFPNDEAVFGLQQIMTAQEVETGRVEKLLISATSLSIDDIQRFVAGYGGVCWPAHIDRAANSLLATIGCPPQHLCFPTLEVYRPSFFFAQEENRRYRLGHRIVTNSDAHRLEAMHAEGDYGLELEECSFGGLRAALGL